MRKAAIFAGAAISVVPAPAFAHSEIKEIGSFYSGLLHPFLVPAHIMALIAAGLLIGQATKQEMTRPVLAFLLASMVALAGTLIWPDLPLTTGILMTSAITGMVVAMSSPRMRGFISLLAAVSGLLVGLDSAAAGATRMSTALLLSGTFVSGAYVMLMAVALTLEPRYHWQKIGARIVGSWIAAASILVLALTVFGSGAHVASN